MERKPTKNDALEALDFIINVLKEHEKDLDRLISQLGIITETLGDTGEITGKIENIEDRISNLQGEITNLIKCVGLSKQTPAHITTRSSTPTPVTIKCKQWEEFKNMASGAEIVSYLFKEAEGTFQADALANGKVISYIGEFPNNSSLLKLWLSRELEINEEDIFEGFLKIG